MYSYIINPLTNKKVDINSKLGRDILKNYINQLGGSTLGDVSKIMKDKRKGKKKPASFRTNRKKKPKKKTNKTKTKLEPGVALTKAHKTIQKLRDIKLTGKFYKDWRKKIDTIFDPITSNLDTSKVSLDTLSKLYSKLNAPIISSRKVFGLDNDLITSRDNLLNSWAAICYPYICALTDSIFFGEINFKNIDLKTHGGRWNKPKIDFNETVNILFKKKDDFDTFSRNIFRIIESIDKRFFVFKANKYFTNSHSGHANVIIIDKYSKTIEYYEPWGGSEYSWKKLIHSNQFEEIVKSLFGYLLDKKTGNYKFVSVKKYLPYLGVQNIMDFGGLCDLFSFYYLSLRLSNPDHSRLLISSYLINGKQQLRSCNNNSLPRDFNKNIVGCTVNLIIDQKKIIEKNLQYKKIILANYEKFIKALEPYNIDRSRSYIEIEIKSIKEEFSTIKLELVDNKTIRISKGHTIRIKFKDLSGVYQEVEVKGINDTLLYHLIVYQYADLKIRIKKLMFFLNLFIFKNNRGFYEIKVLDELFQNLSENKYSASIPNGVNSFKADVNYEVIINNEVIKKNSRDLILKNSNDDTYLRTDIAKLVQSRNQVRMIFEKSSLQEWFPGVRYNIYSKVLQDKKYYFYLNTGPFKNMFKTHFSDNDNVYELYKKFVLYFKGSKSGLKFNLSRSLTNKQKILINDKMMNEIMPNLWGYYDRLIDGKFSQEVDRVFKAPEVLKPLDILEIFEYPSIMNIPQVINDSFCKQLDDEKLPKCSDIPDCIADKAVCSLRK